MLAQCYFAHVMMLLEMVVKVQHTTAVTAYRDMITTQTAAFTLHLQQPHV
jgi:hypothetical protein